MYRTILRYDTILTIRTLYCTIHEHLRYADIIQNFLHKIQYVSYDTYRVSYDTDNYAVLHHGEHYGPMQLQHPKIKVRQFEIVKIVL